MRECVNIEENRKNCSCTAPCDKRGLCCECIAYHRAKQQLPGCYFTQDQEKTYDRSIAYYVKANNIKI